MCTHIYVANSFKAIQNKTKMSTLHTTACKVIQWHPTSSIKWIIADVSDIMVTEYYFHDITSTCFSLFYHHLQNILNICIWTSTFQALPPGFEQKDKDVIYIVSVSAGRDLSLHSSFANYFQYSYQTCWWSAHWI
jgi:hypothetical protein